MVSGIERDYTLSPTLRVGESNRLRPGGVGRRRGVVGLWRFLVCAALTPKGEGGVSVRRTSNKGSMSAAPAASIVGASVSKLKLLGLSALGLAVFAAAQTQSPQATLWIGEHLALCLSGGATPPGVGFLGHCAACWAAVALTVTGAGVLLVDGLTDQDQRANLPAE